MFAHPRAKPRLDLSGLGVAWCYNSISTYAQTPCSSCKFEKIGPRETSPYFTCGAFSFPPCFRRLKSRTDFDFASLTHLPFWILSRSFLKILQWKTRFLGWFPRSLKWCLLPHQRLLASLTFIPLWLICGALGRIVWDSLVPHDVVEAKTGSKKKLVMQLDRDVQVWNIFGFF
jgi:hypothetical protein